MSASSKSSRKPAALSGPAIFAVVESAMRRASRKVAAENKRLGIPLIVRPRKASGSR
jgi:carbamoylphosphate synthase large subunit